MTSRHAIVFLVALVAIGGCSQDNSRFRVGGRVTFDGEPMPEGKITFIPLPGTSSPTAGATIRNGEFEINQAKGLRAGEFEVSIKAIKPTGKKVYDEESGGKIDEMRPYVPARYNTQTELRATIHDDEANDKLLFKLTGT